MHNPGATLDTEAGAAAVNVLLSEQVDRIFSGDLGAETLKRLMDSGIGSFLLRDHHRSLAEILNIKDNPIIIKPDLL